MKGTRHITSQKVIAFYYVVCFYDTNSFTVINALNNFANITLSSLYFDITKDSLYADNVKSRERRAIVTVLEQVYIISGVHSIYFDLTCRFWPL
jgi:isoleucyl-tRNA synthetase